MDRQKWEAAGGMARLVWGAKLGFGARIDVTFSLRGGV